MASRKRKRRRISVIRDMDTKIVEKIQELLNCDVETAWKHHLIRIETSNMEYQRRGMSENHSHHEG